MAKIEFSETFDELVDQIEAAGIKTKNEDGSWRRTIDVLIDLMNKIQSEEKEADDKEEKYETTM